MNDQAAMGPLARQLLKLEEGERAQQLHIGLQLARASQVTLLRLQLALHGADRRGAMAALASLLDLDAEMESLAAATLGSEGYETAQDQAVAEHIAREKAAIAAEKHLLTGHVGRADPGGDGDFPGEAPSELHFAASPPVPTVVLADDPEADARYAPEPRRSRWPVVLALICLLAIGLGVFVYLRPEQAAGLADQARAQAMALMARYS
ncbi:hypothetical protein [Sphingomonas sp.]|uniref:hypothetical protein n=1 Tax=Sphingomonas sp. TaxID=28214 RepID=UPI00257D7C9E|nr:hypothetical protein [Sphingomonas sp.]